MLKVAHIVNPVIVKESSDLFVAQPITFASMKTAQDYAQSQGIEVKLYSAQFSEDHAIVPPFFIRTPDLDRSTLDIKNFKIKRKLPLIGDILDRLHELSEADYFIYTNVDIAVLPNLYVTIAELINQGYDAFIINRRTISNKYKTIEEIPLMYSELGNKHPGLDCFVFPRKSYENYQFNQVFIGSMPIGYTIAINMLCNANNFNIFKNLHLTFHIGRDGFWKKDNLEDYEIFNIEETDKMINYYLSKNNLTENELITKYLATLYRGKTNNSTGKIGYIKRRILLEIAYKKKGLSTKLQELSQRIDDSIKV